MTTASLSPLLKWAQDMGVKSSLERVLQACLVHERPGAVGSVLLVLSKQESAELFQKFAEENHLARGLAKLCMAVGEDNKELLAKYRPMPVASPSKDRFRGSLDTLYLFAFIATGLPADKGLASQISRLRIWLLFHCVCNCQNGVVLEQNTKVVANGLRQAADGDLGWQSLFFSLKSSSNLYSLSSFEWSLVRRAEALLASDTNKKSNDRSDSHTRFLRALVRVARYEVEAVADYVQPNYLSPPSQDLFSEQVVPRLLQDDVSVLGEIHCSDETDFVSVEVEPADSYLHQRLKASTVLLNTVQQNQFLPWDWDLPKPYEITGLDAWLQISDKDPSIRFLKAVTWIALKTGRSFNRVLEIGVVKKAVPQMAEDWILATGTVLVRKSQRRENSWQPEAQDFDWIQPLAEYEELVLPAEHNKTFLNLIQQKPFAKTLADLWHQPNSPSEAWLDAVRGIAPRLKPGMLGAVFPYQLYAKTNDPLLARIYSRHPQTGLPGSAAYPSWSNKSLHDVLAATRGEAPRIYPVSFTNALGSRLCPIEERLCLEIEQAQARLHALAKTDLIKFHNAHTAFWNVLLIAATGARPVRAVFESWQQFDLRHGFVFINDKASGEGRDGRLVPLPTKVTDLLQTQYKKYLGDLAEWLKPISADFANDVKRLSQGCAVSPLPMFFMLSISEGSLSWSPVSEAGIVVTRLFQWPLPLRHFRHRMSQQLRLRGVDPEVIDGWLGHAEQGLASYGDYSFRSFTEDAKRYRFGIDESFASLPWCLDDLDWGRCFEVPARRLDVSSVNTQFKLFGIQERKQVRKNRISHAIRIAKQKIDLQLGGRLIHELDAEEIETLRKDFLFNQNGIPKTYGYVQYEYLLMLLERAERRTGVKTHISRRVLLLRDEPSQFEISSAWATGNQSEFLKWLNARPIEQFSLGKGFRRAATWGVAHLILESRLTDWNQLKDVLAGKNYRVIRYHQQYYFEHFLEDKDAPTSNARMTTRRIPISVRAAYNLGYAATSTNQFDAAESIADIELKRRTEIYSHLAQAKQVKVGTLLQHLAEWVDQSNCREYPGVVAGWLAGRVISYSLNWHDWVRLTDGCPRDFEDEYGGASDPIDDVPFSPAPTLISESATKESLQKSARAFVKDLRKVIFLDADIPSKGQRPTRRTQLVGLGQEVVQRYSGSISPAIEMLGYWVCSLLLRSHRGSLIKLSTVGRYFSALSEPLVGLAYQIDLSDLDENELTDLYRNVVESGVQQDRHYRLMRLRAFHSWLSKQGRVDDPEWQEVGAYQAGPQVSAGVFTESEYLNCFARLQSAFSAESALLLLLMYRFGLRRSDAQGLTLGDILNVGGTWVVVVQGNKFRPLKTRFSRRVVPAVAKMALKEQQFFEDWTARIKAEFGEDNGVPIFPELSQSRHARKAASSTIVRVLREVTGSRHLTGHHARHAAANYVGTALAGFQNGPWGRLVARPGHHAAIQNLLLGSGTVGRRSLPAAQRYLGHALPSTTCTSYLHFLGDLAAEWIKLPRENCVQPMHAFVLDEVPLFCPILLNRKANQAQLNPMVSAILYLRLQVQGARQDRAAEIVGIDPATAERIDSSVDKVAERLRLNKSAKARVPANLQGREKTGLWLSRITADAWQRVLHKTKTLLPECQSAGRSILNLQESLGLIGSSCQLLAWSENHVHWIVWALDFLGLGYEQLKQNHTACLPNQLGNAWEELTRSKAIVHELFQIDSASAGDHGEFRVAQRCAFKFKENNDFWIRNSLEFALVLTVLSCCGAN